MSDFSGGTINGKVASLDNSIPFELQVARNLVHRTRIISVFGRNEGVSTAEETLWEFGGDPVYPVTAAAVSITSTSTDDSGIGAGGRDVHLIGLDSDYNLIEEFVTTSGTVAVTSTQEYLRINHAQVHSVGSSLTNQGDIVGTVGGNPQFLITIGDGIAHNGFLTIPNGFTGYLKYVQFTAGKDKSIDGSVFIKRFNEAWHRLSHTDFYQQNITVNYNYSVVLPEKTEIRLTAVADLGTNNVVSGRFSLIMFEDTPYNIPK